jgi:hypothetical protein
MICPELSYVTQGSMFGSMNGILVFHRTGTRHHRHHRRPDVQSPFCSHTLLAHTTRLVSCHYDVNNTQVNLRGLIEEKDGRGNDFARRMQAIENACSSDDVVCDEEWLAGHPDGGRRTLEEAQVPGHHRKLQTAECSNLNVALLMVNCLGGGPWGQGARIRQDIVDVFGAHACVDIVSATVPSVQDLEDGDYDVIIVEGSASLWATTQTWLEATGNTALTNLANEGASLFINAAPWSGYGSDGPLPFDARLNMITYSRTVTVTNTDLLAGSFPVTTSNYQGSSFAHAVIENLPTGFSSFIDGVGAVLVGGESDSGSQVLLGGMTTSNFHSPQADARNLHKNILEYLCRRPPVAICQDLTLSADDNCQGSAIAADVDSGSTDPNGDVLTLVLEPTAPYSLGATEVELTVTNPSGASDTCTATVTVVDDELPIAICDPGPNPSGNVPAANNQDGFWTISATDNCQDDLPIVVEDTGTEMQFDGHFAEGTNVHYVQAPGTKNPKQKSGSGSVDWKLTGSGDMKVIATDAAGNTGDVLCLAPQRVLLRRS